MTTWVLCFFKDVDMKPLLISMEHHNVELLCHTEIQNVVSSSCHIKRKNTLSLTKGWTSHHTPIYSLFHLSAIFIPSLLPFAMSIIRYTRHARLRTFSSSGLNSVPFESSTDKYRLFAQPILLNTKLKQSHRCPHFRYFFNSAEISLMQFQNAPEVSTSTSSYTNCNSYL